MEDPPPSNEDEETGKCCRVATCCLIYFGAESHLSNAETSTWCRPSLNFEVDDHEPNDIIMEAQSMLSLLALGDEAWSKSGRFLLNDQERQRLLHKIDKDREGTLDMKEFESFASNPKKRAFIDMLPSSARGILSKTLVSLAFKTFDEDKNNKLDLGEWSRFLDYLAQLRLRYLQQMAFQQFRAYWGRGQPRFSDDTGRISASKMSKLLRIIQADIGDEIAEGRDHHEHSVQIGLAVRDQEDLKAWCADFYYYSANNHPLHGIFACDANNRLERLDRVMMELATLGFSCLMLFLYEDVKDGDGPELPLWLQQRRAFRLCCITIPSMMLYYGLLFLFTTPGCGMADESNASIAELRRALLISKLGDALGNIAVFALILVTVLEVCNSLDDVGATILTGLFMSRGASYFITWVLQFLVYFNPVIAWGSAKPGSSSLGDLVGLGQWTIERQRIHLVCHKLPDSAHHEINTVLQKKSRACSCVGSFKALRQSTDRDRQGYSLMSKPLPRHDWDNS